MEQIWTNVVDLKTINAFSKTSMAGHLGIKITKINKDSIVGKMPIDDRTKQPLGLLHGGASAAFSETLGSIASTLCIDLSEYSPVGVEINANHLNSGKSGWVTGITRPIKIGKTIHVWNTEIFDDKNRLLCVSRLTVMIIKNKIGIK